MILRWLAHSLRQNQIQNLLSSVYHKSENLDLYNSTNYAKVFEKRSINIIVYVL